VTGFRIYTLFWLRPTGAASTAASAVSRGRGGGCIRYRRQSILVRRYPLPAYLLASSKVTGTALRVPVDLWILCSRVRAQVRWAIRWASR